VASGGWPGLSGGHGRRGARRNRGVARLNRALPARDRARKGWERWNWLAARAGASATLPIPSGSALFRRAPHRPGLQRGRATLRRPPAARRAFVKLARCPAREAAERWNWLAARAGASSEFYEGSPSRREAAGGLLWVARPLWMPWAAGCTTE